MSDTDSDTTRAEINQLNINMARLRREIPDLIHNEIQYFFKEFIKEIRKPKPPVEVGYRYE